MLKEKPATKEERWAVVRGSEARKRKHPPRLWLAKSVLREKELAVLSGRFDSLKSTFALELAASEACTFDFLGEHEVEKKGRVFVIQEEIPVDDYDARVKRVLDGQPDEAADNLLLWSRKGFVLETHTEGFQAMERIIADEGVVLVVLDNLSRMYPPGFKENDAPPMTELLKPLSRLQDRYGVAFLIVHHDRKPLGDDRGWTPRGSSVLENYPDVRIHIDRSKKDLTRATVTIRGRGFGSGEFGVQLDEQTLRLKAADVLPMTTDVQEKTKEVVKMHAGSDGVTAAEVAPWLGLKEDAARKRLARMAKDGKLSVDKNSTPHRYFVPSEGLDKGI